MRRPTLHHIALLAGCVILTPCASSGATPATASSANASQYFQSWPTGASPDVFGAVPLEIFMLTGDSSYLELGLGFADSRWATATPSGITSEARYGWTTCTW
jgi:hypothetical protein